MFITMHTIAPRWEINILYIIVYDRY